MTVAEAYRVMGARADSDSVELERIYRARLQKLQRLLIPGHLVAIRQQAQQQVAELAQAWEVLQKHVVRRCPPPDRRTYSGAGATTWSPPRMVEMGVGFLITAAIMCVITSLCFTQAPLNRSMRKSVPAKPKEEIPRVATRPVAPPIVETPMARMRVLSVPWCEVELDGRPFGPSGQSAAFEVSEGTHTLVLQRNGMVLTRKITLRAGRQSVVKIDFEGERVYVDQQ
jgi:hypothetical protein